LPLLRALAEITMKSFIIFGRDNGQYAYDKSAACRCMECGIIDREKSSRLPLSEIMYDFSSTYDNELVISERVFLELVKYVDESNFEKSGKYYYVFPKVKVEFDSAIRKTKFGPKCSLCGNNSYVIGVSPAYLKRKLSKSGLYATDLKFGDTADEGSNLTPGIILSEDLLGEILSLKVSGLSYEQANS
ncbi:hypothetical protein, partial [Microbulbifer mangrovi]|uniref:hypothetical protein n=1 Tax=Microbulbifer mangrovi TaxID=927787 RepID=UPI00130147D7